MGKYGKPLKLPLQNTHTHLHQKSKVQDPTGDQPNSSGLGIRLETGPGACLEIGGLVLARGKSQLAFLQ